VGGRTRHVLFDTTGVLLVVVIHPADLHDRDRTTLAAGVARYAVPPPGDTLGGCRLPGTTCHLARHSVELSGGDRAHTAETCLVAPRQRAPSLPTGLQLLPRRWVVERAIAWPGYYRHLSTDDEVLPPIGEMWIYLAMIRPMLARPAR
jgi:putative transposase